ncbi:hypothetical protein [Psychrobium sp. 1_MG-2023]|uniref:hypothetical protein n=1 Tax=Psychrobium sp. 1_MG-2023 TaxID=3062624 RepID=UPI00268E1409
MKPEMSLDKEPSAASLLKQEIALAKLLERMPENVQNSFTEEQLSYLKHSLGARQWGNHAVYLRSTVKFFRYRYF